MAYNFIGLVNDVNSRLNEVPLTDSTFDTAVGFYAAAKDAVNAAIRQVNFEQYEWPFNHVTQEEVLLENVTRYSFPTDAKTVDMDTFRIKADATIGNSTSRLSIMSYEDYLDNHVEQEYNYSKTGLPTKVFRTPDMGFGLVPAPDNSYELVYEYYRVPTDLIKATDIPTIPEQFRSILVDGAMHYAYLFRGNTQDATVMQDKFSRGLKQMRSIYINRTDYVRDTMIVRQSGSNGFVRIK